jgi:hypothetical protein
MFTKSNLASLLGQKLIVRSVPVFVTDPGKGLLSQAYDNGRKQRWAETRQAYAEMGAKFPDDPANPLTDEAAVGLLKSALDVYQSDPASRGKVLTAIYRLLRLWDAEVLNRAAAGGASSLQKANADLNVANRAQADLRAELDHKEGLKGYRKDLRILLGLIEKRLYLARVGLRQKDYSLAEAHAEQMSAAAQALIPYVKGWPLEKTPSKLARSEQGG